MRNFNRRIEFVMECTGGKVLCGTYQSAHNEIGKGGSMSAFGTLPKGVQQRRTVKPLRSLDKGARASSQEKVVGSTEETEVHGSQYIPRIRDFTRLMSGGGFHKCHFPRPSVPPVDIDRGSQAKGLGALSVVR